MNGPPFTVLGIDVGGTKIAGGVVCFPEGCLCLERTIATAPTRGGDAVLKDVLRLAKELAGEAKEKGAKVEGVGLALCELVDPAGRILSANCIPWQEETVRDTLSSLGPVTIEADVRAAGLAEALFGTGRSLDCFLYVTIGTGISCCLMLEGKPYLGARGATGTMASSALSVPCENCSHISQRTLEEIAAGPALVSRYNQRCLDTANSGEEVLAAAAAGDEVAWEVVRSAGEALGAHIGLLVNVLDPNAVIIGGGLAKRIASAPEQSEFMSELLTTLLKRSPRRQTDGGLVRHRLPRRRRLINPHPALRPPSPARLHQKDVNRAGEGRVRALSTFFLDPLRSKRLVGSVWAAMLVFGAVPGPIALAAMPPFTLPPGFEIERVAGPPEIQFPMFACLDARGRLLVAESSGLDLYAELQKLTRKCRVSMLTDTNGDGRYDRASVFADQLVFPMGLVWAGLAGNKLYVADPPDLVVLEDADGDGKADKRTVILTGFGHSDNGSLHGLTFGPDGWLYMTLGQPDGYRLRRGDGSVIEGKSGALLRCRPDGSQVEVVCRGFDNLVEVAFLPAGEIIGTDNWFALPSDGVRDALVHLVEGGLYPLQLRDSGTAFLHSGDPLPAVALYPAVAHSGLICYRGPNFPESMRGLLFSAQFNTRKIVSHQLQRSGSTFQSQDQDFLTTSDPDFHPSDVVEDADGSLLVLDTGSWYVHHCPTGRIRQAPARGGIYRVRYAAGEVPADSRGAKLDWSSASVEELIRRLSDARPAVRDRATEALVQAGAAAAKPLVKVLRASESFEEKAHALWALTRIGSVNQSKDETSPKKTEPGHEDGWISAVIELLRSDQSDLVALAARALGRSAQSSAEAGLLPLLRHSAPHVRLAAAEALAHCGRSASVAPAIEALTTDLDQFLEHALIHLLYRIASTRDLKRALDHSHPRVQKAALILLDQAPHHALAREELAKRLSASDADLSRTARRLLKSHPEWISDAQPVLRELISRKNPNPAERETLRELVLAFQTQAEVITLVAEAASGQTDGGSGVVRGLMLEWMTQTDLEKAPGPWAEAIRQALEADDMGVRLRAVQAANALRVAGVEEQLARIAEDAHQPDALRLEACRALVRQQSALKPAVFDFLESRLGKGQGAGTRLAAAEALADAVLTGEQLLRLIERAQADRVISPLTILAAVRRGGWSEESTGALLAYLRERVRAGWSISPEQIHWLESRVPVRHQALLGELKQNIDARYDAQREQLAQLSALLKGGDPNRGHSLFLEKAACAVCHRVGKKGGLVGPDLTKIGAIRSGQDLIESLVLPSASLAQGYESYQVTLKTGDELTGIRVPQPGQVLLLRDASGAETRLTESQIQRMDRLDLSLMPEGLLSALSSDEIRDLLAYLQSLK